MKKEKKHPDLTNHSITKISQQLNDVLLYTVALCISRGISLEINPSKQIEDEDGSLYSGCFDDTNKDKLKLYLTLIHPKGDQEAAATILHETCHSDQYFEKDPVYWINGDIKNCIKLYDRWGKWLSYKRYYSAEQVNEFISACMEIEADCERRTLERLKEYSIQISEEEYIRKANAYILFYRVMEKERKWCNVEAPSRIPEILDLMPSNEIITDVSKVDPKFFDLVRDHCMKKESKIRKIPLILFGYGIYLLDKIFNLFKRK